MAGFAQTTINKLNQVYERWLPKLPAEVNVRNVLIFSVTGAVMYWFNHGGIGFYALCRAHA